MQARPYAAIDCNRKVAVDTHVDSVSSLGGLVDAGFPLPLHAHKVAKCHRKYEQKTYNATFRDRVLVLVLSLFFGGSKCVLELRAVIDGLGARAIAG